MVRLSVSGWVSLLVTELAIVIDRPSSIQAVPRPRTRRVWNGDQRSRSSRAGIVLRIGCCCCVVTVVMRGTSSAYCLARRTGCGPCRSLGTSMTGHSALKRTYWLTVPGSIHLPALAASTISCASVWLAVSMMTRLASPSETRRSVGPACSSSSWWTVSRRADSARPVLLHRYARRQPDIRPRGAERWFVGGHRDQADVTPVCLLRGEPQSHPGGLGAINANDNGHVLLPSALGSLPV